MCGKEFFDRVGVQQFCDFLRFGQEWGPTEPGTLQERYQKHSKAFCHAVEQYRKDLLAEDWTGLSAFQQEVRAEELSGPILDGLVGIETVTFEAGFLAGYKLSHSL